MKSTSRPLTSRQREVLAFVRGYVRQKGFPPSLHDIMERFGFSSTNAASAHLRALERKGFIARTSGKARAICLLPQSGVRA